MTAGYCVSRFQTVRRRTVEVKVGAVGVGAAHPIRLQSMTTSDTQDVEATVRQCIALAEAGCEIVRVTAPNVPAARCLRPIREKFTAAGFGRVPLVADIHFLPPAAMEAVEHVEKVRVNPGNYADKKKFVVREYADAEYERELQRLHEAFSPLVKRCRELGRALRIGANHGSLSDRIMNRYGDTPLGMVESALEFVRIAESHGFHDLILSMKASNPKVMIQAYRLLAARMDRAHRPYPLHLGVTEAGDGEDGRIKSAIGIGALLLDGLGDTIRVSLTEDSVYEIPVARAIADKVMSLWVVERKTGDREPVTGDGRPASAKATAGLPSPFTADSIDPFQFTRRETTVLTLSDRCAVGPEQPPRVIVRIPTLERLAGAAAALASPLLKDTPAEGLLVPVADTRALEELRSRLAAVELPADFLVLELGESIAPGDLDDFLASCRGRCILCRRFRAPDADLLEPFAALARRHGHFLALDISPADLSTLAECLREIGDERLIFTISSVRPALHSPKSDGGSPGGDESPASGLRLPMSEPGHSLGAYRALVEGLRQIEFRAPIWIRNTSATACAGRDGGAGDGGNSFLDQLIDASFLTGGLLCDGLGDLVSMETEIDPARSVRLAYNVLQGAGARISKTEFVACPSCGRTLFDLQTTTQRIREKTGHLQGVKIAIMGCIVNGPGEMADADFGYVGGAPGKINLYVGKNCVQYNIPQAEADDRLVALIKEHGKWSDPEPAPAN